jgi:hypothetical protein
MGEEKKDKNENYSYAPITYKLKAALHLSTLLNTDMIA